MEAGWFEDRADPAIERWWDGERWTALTRSVGSRADGPALRPVAPPGDDATALRTPVGLASPVSGPAAVLPARRWPLGLIFGAVGLLLLLAGLAVGIVVTTLSASDEKRIVATDTADTTDQPETAHTVPVTAVPTTPPTAATVTAPTITAPTISSTASSPISFSGPVESLTPVGQSATSNRPSADHTICDGTPVSYGPELAFDGNPDTAWATARPRNSGEAISARFGSRVELQQISLFNGYVKVARRSVAGCQVVNSYPYNRRIDRIRVELDGGAAEEFDLRDTTQLQVLTLREPRLTSTVTIRVLATTLPAGADDDTLISEIYFRGVP